MVPGDERVRKPAAGPLTVSKANPRYFTAGSGNVAGRRAVYLTGSHIWNNFQDGMGPGPGCAATAEQLDYDAYLEFLKSHGHNFIRLWRWEQFKSQAAGGGYHLCMTPQPWARTGPGTAVDGKPKFDLESFDRAYFDRLRSRVSAAGDQGIYVAVMLFDGWALHLSPAPDNVEGHPFHAANNVNGIGITSIVDYQVLPLDPRVQAFQEAYIRKVIDTVQDLPNVLYEVANESSGGGSVDRAFAEALGLGDPPGWGDSTEWQYWVIDFVKQYEQQQGYDKHPIGMTMQFPVERQTEVNDPLFNSRADWISPGYDDEIFTGGRHPMAPGSPASHWFDDPPAADGRKVVITDTDHYAAGKGDALWAWKSFLRGHHPILMDFGIIEGVNQAEPSPVLPGFRTCPPGDGRHPAVRGTDPAQRNAAARRTQLDRVRAGEPRRRVPRPAAERDLRAVHGDPGARHVLGRVVQRHHAATKEAVKPLAVESAGSAGFTAPFAEAGPAVVYLKQVGRR